MRSKRDLIDRALKRAGAWPRRVPGRYEDNGDGRRVGEDGALPSTGPTFTVPPARPARRLPPLFAGERRLHTDQICFMQFFVGCFGYSDERDRRRSLSLAR